MAADMDPDAELGTKSGSLCPNLLNKSEKIFWLVRFWPKSGWKIADSIIMSNSDKHKTIANILTPCGKQYLEFLLYSFWFKFRVLISPVGLWRYSRHKRFCLILLVHDRTCTNLNLLFWISALWVNFVILTFIEVTFAFW